MIRRIYPKRRLKTNVAVDELLTLPENYARFHVVSGDNPGSATLRSEIVPSNRSGHRMFTTRDYLYVIGGYDSINGSGVIFKEIWRMNLLTRHWMKMEMENPETFPDALASFAICQTAPWSNKIVLFGGTTIPFGQTSSSTCYMLTMRPNGKVSSEIMYINNPPRAVYGHAMIHDEDTHENRYYAIGGTTGHEFFLDIYSLYLDDNSNLPEWKWEKLGDWTGTGENNEPPGLYRLEVVHDKGKILMFGGGTPDYVQGFEKMYYYDMEKRRYDKLRTSGDPTAQGSQGYPAPRRCHSITQWGRKVILAGGCGTDQIVEGNRINHIFGDVWIFDLDTYTWAKHPTDMNIAVFFHTAAITSDGCLLIHGGVSDERSHHRSNTLQALWISPPNLLHWASQTVIREIKKCSLDKSKSKKARGSGDSPRSVDIADLVISRCDTIYSRVVGCQSPA